MTNEIQILAATAATIGFFHTLLGPDHYLPFIVMSKSGEWSLKKTALVTFLCGLGHVMSSVVLGFIGISLGIAVSKLEAFEAFRGSLAGWALLTFGLLYFIWGVRRAIQNKPHAHIHSHKGDFTHTHTHTHTQEHAHAHLNKNKKSITPWVLFTIFVFGPCEPLIPILMYPAAKNNISGVIIVTALFSLATIGTMMSIVIVSASGLNLLPLKKLERYSHAMAGAAIFLCGASIQFLGL
ncbi:MAG: sulfite exporter TauE/SafE family protein [Kiritimatiellae bacterium]|jgi:nickel/cobalt exporter|nr:sulfite exporter TauE/SafE family protein [Kiritimatiellia bacterium]